MIVENSGLNGLKSDLAYLDESAEKVGFVRWQWNITGLHTTIKSNTTTTNITCASTRAR
ncbi:hypothetical protein HMSSN036_22120 [Paenibacillus macerans]|nr:hypothetical protein HMSSN036_22120 [Paenibacillus macerans]